MYHQYLARHLRRHVIPLQRALSSQATSCPGRGPRRRVTPSRLTLALPFLRNEVARFDAGLPVEKALTPPASWFTDPSFHELELDSVFRTNYVALGGTHQIPEAGEYFTGQLGHFRYLVIRDDQGVLRAFHNVCRHHAMCLITSDKGQLSTSHIECPYHGWTYRLDGRLTKATRITGIQDFSPKDYGLIEIPLRTWGPLIFLQLGGSSCSSTSTDNSSSDNSPSQSDLSHLDPLLQQLDSLKFTKGMQHVHSRLYTLNCNWKVVVDNYLDGGMHVPYAHKGLGSTLDFDSYKTTVYNGYSTQICLGSSQNKSERVGEIAMYAHIYPNLMINRYGPWCDTNIVIPRSANECDVIYDYFVDQRLADSIDPTELETFIEDSLDSSDVVQNEDTYLCENVQKGLESPSYDVGRYAPQVEFADHDFHVRLARQLQDHLSQLPA